MNFVAYAVRRPMAALMRPIFFAIRRPIAMLMLVVVLMGGGALAFKMRPEVFASLNSSTTSNDFLGYIREKAEQVKGLVVGHKEEQHHEAHKILATNPESKDVTLTQYYVCQIHSQRHIKVCAWRRDISRRSRSKRVSR